LDEDAGLAQACSASSCPHFRQNFAPTRFGSPQLGQPASRRVPHSSQKAASVAFWCWHWWQRIIVLTPDVGKAAAAVVRPSSAPLYIFW